MQQENGSQSAKGSAWRNPAFTALSGALIGAFVGLVGSILVYTQAEAVQDATQSARRADIRRSAYAEVGANYQAYKVAVFGMIASYANIASDKKPEQIYNTVFMPAYQRLAQAETTARLVGSPEVRKLLDVVSDHRNTLGKLVTGPVILGEKIDDKKLTRELEEVRKSYNAFLDKAEGEVI
ncbi:hypothetical protein [Streptomyces sp. NBC_01296]|uniref:hypothetical protein n=1 Tax=Streptomyces sp. NBC_01296 TaxID=2903816 RepID=UPI002E12AB99|nr:hypothetical protein OG299_42245 [Streptomyces sp. NBC_01296]